MVVEGTERGGKDQKGRSSVSACEING